MTDPTPSPSRAPDRADAHRERVEIREVLTEAFGPLPTDHIHLVDRLRVHLAERRLAAGAEVEALRAFKDLVEECGPTHTAEAMLRLIESASWTCGRAIAKATRGAELGSRVEVRGPGGVIGSYYQDERTPEHEDTRPKRLEHLDAVGPVQAGRLRTFTDEASDKDGSS